jgi:hypothetical protein
MLVEGVMKSVGQITDRAKRYRANSDTVDMPRVCMFCAATTDLQVDHLDGFEEHGEPENLIILCRSCNQLKSSVFKAAGLGRRTEQYNPFLGLFGEGGLLGGRTTHTHTGRAIKKMKTRVKHERHAARREELGIRGREGSESDRHYRELSEMVAGGMSLKDAMREIGNPAEVPMSSYKGVMLYRRGAGPVFLSLDPISEFDTPAAAKAAVDAFKNPASSYSAWSHAVGVLRGEIEGSPRRAAAVIRSTPPGRRLAFLESMRRNPGAKTLGAWVNALLISKGDVPGDQEAAAKLIHETPKSRRSEFQKEVWAIRKDRYGPGGRQDSLPF